MFPTTLSFIANRARLIRRGVAAGAIGCCLSVTAHAELQWEQTRLVLEPATGASDATGFFEFVNRGTKPVRIVEVQSGCGCTVAAPEQQTIEPGAKGRIRAVYHIGSKQGRQTVDVTVTTQEPEVRRYTLAVDVGIKESAVLAPRLLYWRVGEDPTSKTIQVKLAPEFRLIGAESASADFAVDVLAPAPDAVQLRITPRDTWAKRSGTIKVKIAREDQPPVEVVATARVL